MPREGPAQHTLPSHVKNYIEKGNKMWVITRKGEPATVMELLNKFGKQPLPLGNQAEHRQVMRSYITARTLREAREKYCKIAGIDRWKQRGKGVHAYKITGKKLGSK